MTIGELLIKQIELLGGNGIGNKELQCGCGDHDGWFPCECCDMEECEPARWCFCRDCEFNGKCHLQVEFDYSGRPDEGCYRMLTKKEGGE